MPADPAPRQPQDITRAVLLMAASAVLFTAMTILIKLLAARYSYAVQTLFRQLAGLAIIAPAVLRSGRAAFATQRPGFMLFRCTIATLALLMSFYTFQVLPLADANALSFTRVLWVAPIAAIALGERIGWNRGVPIALGFAGVLMISRPDAGAVDFAHLVALAGAMMLAGTSVAVRSLTRDHSAFVLVVWWSVIGTLVVLPFALVDWVWPSPADLGLLLIMGALGVGNQWTAIKALEYAEASVVMPVDYLRLVLAIAAGLLLFGEFPDLATWLGSLTIVGSSMLLLLGERRAERHRQAAVARAEEG